jgi:hypothetical protein
MTNESQNFTQMNIFSHIDDMLHNYFATFCCALGFLNFFDFFMVVVVQVRSFVGLWYYWLGHRGGERSHLIKLIKVFLITAFSTPMIHRFSGITSLSLLFVVSGT